MEWRSTENFQWRDSWIEHKNYCSQLTEDLPQSCGKSGNHFNQNSRPAIHPQPEWTGTSKTNPDRDDSHH
jgi:hypothetical protein